MYKNRFLNHIKKRYIHATMNVIFEYCRRYSGIFYIPKCFISTYFICFYMFLYVFYLIYIYFIPILYLFYIYFILIYIYFLSIFYLFYV